MRPTKGEIERNPGFGAGNRLVETEQQGQVAMNAFFFKHFRGADAGPGGGDLDQNVIAADAGLVVLRDDAARLVDGRLGVEGQAGVDFGGDAAGNDFQDPLAEGDGEAFEGQLGDILIAGVLALFVAGFFQHAVDKLLILRAFATRR